jgi:hypothetical protein
MDDPTIKQRLVNSRRRDHSGHHHGQHLFANGKKKEIVVTFTAKDNGKYEMKQDGTVVQELIFNKDDYSVDGQKMKKRDYFLVKFVLDDQTTAGDLQVPPNPMNAIWICTPRQIDPPKCPSNPTYDQQIYALETDPDKDVLWVRNEDMSCEPWAFNIRFLRAGQDPASHSSYVAYDPGGANQNGGAN